MVSLLFLVALNSAPVGDPALESKVKEVLDEHCTACHAEGGDPTDPSEFSLEGDLSGLVGRTSNETQRLLIAPGDPDGSYLMDKLLGTPAMQEDLMPLGDEPLSAEELQLMRDWIASIPGGSAAAAPPAVTPSASAPPAEPAPAPAAAAMDPALEAAAKAVFDEYCTTCHAEGGSLDDPSEFPLEGDLSILIGRKANESDKLLIAPGDPDGSYLMDKVLGTPAMQEELMPLGDDPLPADKLQALRDWIAAMPTNDPAAAATTGPAAATAAASSSSASTAVTPPKKKYKPFHGEKHIVLPTTTTLGKKTFQYRIDHRFGRIGTERGAFGLDAGVIMNMGIGYGIIDGLDVGISRTNSRKAWEFSAKYVPLRQEADQLLSLGVYASLDALRDFDVENQFSGNFMILLSRLWFERWATLFEISYHTGTNKNGRVVLDFGDGQGPVAVNDDRGTLTMGLGSQVWLGKRKRWSFDAEYFLPIAGGGDPDTFYVRGGDADPDGTRIGSWGLGAGYFTGKHFFQLLFTNNREIHPNLAAPGGQSGNPFTTDDGVKEDNPLNEFNFYFGFNLVRQFTLGKNAARWKKEREAKKSGKAGQ
jgi:cytochrome c5